MRVFYKGEEVTIAEAVRRSGTRINESTVRWRVTKQGWTLERALVQEAAKKSQWRGYFKSDNSRGVENPERANFEGSTRGSVKSSGSLTSQAAGTVSGAELT